MADADNQPDDAAAADLDAIALAEQAEAEAAEAEALAAAARARARAIRLRRAAEAEVQAEAEDATATAETAPPTAVTAETTPPEADTAETESAESTRRWWSVRLVSVGLAVAAGLLVCGLLAASGYMIWYHHNAVERRHQAAAFTAAASHGVVNLLSMDFHNAQADVQRVIDSSTGEFRDDFQKRAADFTTVVEKSQAVTEGAVTTTALQSMGKDSAVVLVVGTERVTNVAGAKDEPRAFRLRVSVARDGDQLKMSKVEFVL